MTTIHSYNEPIRNCSTWPHKDLRRARAAAINMIPKLHPAPAKSTAPGHPGAERQNWTAYAMRRPHAELERRGTSRFFLWDKPATCGHPSTAPLKGPAAKWRDEEYFWHIPKNKLVSPLISQGQSALFHRR